MVAVAASLCVRTDEELQDAINDLDKTFDQVAEMYGTSCKAVRA